MKFKLISSKDPKSLEDVLNEYDIKTLGTTFVINGTFYQAFIGELKKTPVKKPTVKPAEEKPAPKKRAPRKPKAKPKAE